MNIAAKVKRFLFNHHIRYQVFSHHRTTTLDDAVAVAGINPKQMARAVVLADKKGLVSAILPLGYQIDLQKFNKLLRRDLKLVPTNQTNKLFYDCEPGSRPVLAEPYGMQMVIDKSLASWEKLYFEPGTHTALIGLDREDFLYLASNSIWANFANECEDKSKHISCKPINQEQIDQIGPRVGSLYQLPVLPPIAQKILSLAKQPDSNPQKLSAILHSDPRISQLVLNCAENACNNKLDKVGSIDEAILRVLDFNSVSHLAVGLAAGQGFCIQEHGPLGLQKFWQHALTAARTAQALAPLCVDKSIDPALAYIGGLMHNFGFLMLGHLFPPEFRLLNKLYATNPNISITLVEKRLIGMGHAQQLIGCGHQQMGAWLMRCWKMPDEVIAMCAHHHAKNYNGKNALYVDLIKATNKLLKAYDLGDSDLKPDDYQVFDKLSLKQEEATKTVEQIMSTSTQQIYSFG